MKEDIKKMLRPDRWEILPAPWVRVQKPNKLKLSDDATSPEYKRLFAPFISDDDLIPKFQGIYIEDGIITATDAHRLLSIPQKVKNKKGLLDILGKQGVKNSYIDVKFPDYPAIFSKQVSFVYPIDLLKLKTYTQAVISGRYTNTTTNLIVYEFGDKDKIAFNGQFMIEIIDAFMLLGFENVYFSFETPNRACIITPDKQAAKYPAKYVGKEIFGLCMPMITQSQDLGASDSDFSTGISVYFSFSDNEIHNADGSIADFNPNADSDENGYVSDEEFSVLKTITKSGSKGSVPILETVKVEKYELFAFDLTSGYLIKGVNMPDGIYNLVNGAFKPSPDFKVEDYPRPEQENTQKGWINAGLFYEVIGEAKDFIGDDELRPAMTGVCINAEGNETKIYSTNAYILYKRTLKNTKLELNNVLLYQPDILHKALKSMEGYDGDLRVLESKYHVIFEDKRIIFYNRKIDARPPSYEQVIPKNNFNVVKFETKELLSVIAEAKKIYPKSDIFFTYPDKQGQTTTPVYSNTKDGGKNNITEEGQKLKTSLTYSMESYQSEDNDRDLAIIMSLNPDTNEGMLGFNCKLLKTVVDLGNSATTELNYDINKRSMYVLDLPPLQDKVESFKPLKIESKKPDIKIEKEQVKVEKKPEPIKAISDKERIENTIKSLMLAKEYSDTEQQKNIQNQISSLKLALKYL